MASLFSLFFLLCLLGEAKEVVKVSTLYPLGGEAVTELRARVVNPIGPLNTLNFFVNGRKVGSVPAELINGQAVAVLPHQLANPSSLVVKYGTKKSNAFKQKFVPGVSTIKSLTFDLPQPVPVLSSLKITITIAHSIISGQPYPDTTHAVFLLDNWLPITCQSISISRKKKSLSQTCTWIIPTTITTGEHQILGYFPGGGQYSGASQVIPIHIVCPSTLADCDNDGICETGTVNDVNNCGGCRKVCNLFEAQSQICSNSVCKVVTCFPGFGNCNGTGCEPLTSLTNCGGCGVPCAKAQASATCSTGACEVASCNTGFGICPAPQTFPVPGPGCGVNLESDVNNCNGCGIACSFPHVATPHCSQASCQFTNADCAANFFDCDGNPSNGCEFTCPAPTVQFSQTGILDQTPGTCVGNTPTAAISAVVSNLQQAKLIRYGTGNPDGNWTTATNAEGIVLAIRAEERGVGGIMPSYQNFYQTVACHAHGTSVTAQYLAHWNYGFSVDLTNAKTGDGKPLTLGDFDATISITSDTPITLTNTTLVIDQDLALVQPLQPFAAGILSDESTDGCFTGFFSPTPFQITGASPSSGFTSATDLITNAPPFLRFLQESTNIAFAYPPFNPSNPNFPVTQPALFHVTLALTPVSPPLGSPACACGISVSMDVSVLPLAPMATCP